MSFHNARSSAKFSVSVALNAMDVPKGKMLRCDELKESEPLIGRLPGKLPLAAPTLVFVAATKVPSVT